MRFIMHVTIPPEKFNQEAANGTAGATMGRILEDLKPEAAYFVATDGNRGGYFVIDIQGPGEMPRLAEPWFMKFNAKVEFLLAMTPEELQAADLEAVAGKWK